MTVPAGTVLRVLARLAPTGRTASASAVVDLRETGSSALWLGYDDVLWATTDSAALPAAVVVPESAELRRLAAIGELHRDERLLRAGWTVLAGPAVVGVERVQLCTPLLSWPVRIEPGRGPRSMRLLPAGDPETTPLVADRGLADLLAEAARFGNGAPSSPQFAAWVREVCDAAELPAPSLRPPSHRPLRGQPVDLIAVAGLVVFTARPTDPTSVEETLLAWAGRDGLDGTALAALYGAGDRTDIAGDRTGGDGDRAGGDGDRAGGAADAPGGSAEVISPLPLSAAQRAVVTAARTRPVTVVSGPPGCGKTHTLAALALDAVARGESVLLATRSQHAAEVIGEQLRRAAGPTPVLFGDTELRRSIADELAGGLPQPPRPDELRQRERALADAVHDVRLVERAVAAALDDERAADRARAAAELAAVYRVSAPALFDDKADLAAARRALASAVRKRGWPLGAWRTDRAVRRLRSLVGAEPGTPIADIEAALRAATDQQTALRLAIAGGTSLAGLRRLLDEHDATLRAAAGLWVDGVTSSEDRRSRGARREVADLASALRAGRAARRRLLLGVGGAELVRALPLWVGTLGDVEDLLPPVPGLFGLIVVDEATHVDQPLAAPALVRAGRAVVAGDPRQLRHVSFVSAAQVESAVDAENAGALSGLLDVPRMSLFDVAAAATYVHWLDEHHRCAPHLIGFAGERFYPDRLSLLTTHPSIADADCISVERVDGRRDQNGVNEVEVAAAVAHVRRRVDAGASSVGVLSPFRAQADAVERAVLGEFSVEEIRGAGLRIGTVHSFQGSECDELVVSLALSDGDPPASWRFANDPNLLAVLTTRARRSVHLITSAADPPGLVAEYVRHAQQPPTETRGEPAADRWTASLADELRRGGERVRTGYPVGRWRVDLVVGNGKGALAIETRPHPDGVDAHLARWRTLAGAGWSIRDAYPTRFGHDPVRATVELLPELDAER